MQIELAQVLTDISNFLQIYGESQVSARIMLKETVPLQLDAMTAAHKALARVRETRILKEDAVFEENSKV
jgi:hypothetical protein